MRARADAFRGLTLLGDEHGFERALRRTLSEFAHSSSSSLELMCHPGYAARVGGDAFNRSHDREAELAALTSPQLRQQLAQMNVRI